MSSPVKQGDVVTLTWDLNPAPAAGSTARVIISELDKPPLVSRSGTLTESRVSIDLTSEETATTGTYFVEIEVTPGPHTYPSEGYDRLVIGADLG